MKEVYIKPAVRSEKLELEALANFGSGGGRGWDPNPPKRFRWCWWGWWGW